MEQDGDRGMVGNASFMKRSRGGTRESFDRDKRKEPGGGGGVYSVEPQKKASSMIIAGRFTR